MISERYSEVQAADSPALAEGPYKVHAELVAAEKQIAGKFNRPALDVQVEHHAELGLDGIDQSAVYSGIHPKVDEGLVDQLALGHAE